VPVAFGVEVRCGATFSQFSPTARTPTSRGFPQPRLVRSRTDEKQPDWQDNAHRSARGERLAWIVRELRGTGSSRWAFDGGTG
jgi:hypothetical protein